MVGNVSVSFENLVYLSEALIFYPSAVLGNVLVHVGTPLCS